MEDAETIAFFPSKPQITRCRDGGRQSQFVCASIRVIGAIKGRLSRAQSGEDHSAKKVEFKIKRWAVSIKNLCDISSRRHSFQNEVALLVAVSP